MVILALNRFRFISLQLKMSRAEKSTYMSQYPDEIQLCCLPSVLASHPSPRVSEKQRHVGLVLKSENYSPLWTKESREKPRTVTWGYFAPCASSWLNCLSWHVLIPAMVCSPCLGRSSNCTVIYSAFHRHLNLELARNEHDAILGLCCFLSVQLQQAPDWVGV